MKIEIIPKTYSSVVKFISDSGKVCPLNFTNSDSNCKLVTLDNVSSLFMTLQEENERIDAIKEFMKHFYGRNVFLTVTRKDIYDFFKKNFVLYYSNIVPCGYNDGFQYHILIKNHGDQRPPIVEVVETKIDKTKILNIVNNAFEATINRNNRLKLIEEGIDALNNQ